MLYRFFPLVLWFAALQLTAQNVTVINNYNGGGDSLLPESYVLKSVTEHTYVINEFEPSNTGTRSLLDQMITYGLRAFIDNSFHVFDDRAQSLASPEKFNAEASGVVRNAVWIHELPFSDDFPGFSRVVKSKVESLRKIDGYTIRFGKDASLPASDGSIGLYTFQRLVYDLKTAVEAEAFDFIDRYMPQTAKRGYDNLKGVILAPKEYRLPGQDGNKTDLANLEPDKSLLLTTQGARTVRRKNDTDDESPFSQQIVNLLEENNRILGDYSSRFANMQQQIDELRESRNDDIRQEMATMRKMIEQIASGEPRPTPGIAISEEVGVSVVFEKNQHDLTLAQKARLNRVEIEMTKHPNYRALITGYADKTGDPDFNAWISQKRAKSVHDYLVSTGIRRDRLTVSFLGDVESASPNPLDRKVVVNFIPAGSAE